VIVVVAAARVTVFPHDWCSHSSSALTSLSKFLSHFPRCPFALSLCRPCYSSSLSFSHKPRFASIPAPILAISPESADSRRPIRGTRAEFHPAPAHKNHRHPGSSEPQPEQTRHLVTGKRRIEFATNSARTAISAITAHAIPKTPAPKVSCKPALSRFLF
jgi:hypothetical protein